MKISAGLKIESLLRDLRLAGHALAEGAEGKVLRAARLDREQSMVARRAAEAGRKGREA